jgi:hypothetical protein
MTAREALVLVIASGAPVSLVLVVAMVRGYRIDLHMERPPKGRNDDR